MYNIEEYSKSRILDKQKPRLPNAKHPLQQKDAAACDLLQRLHKCYRQGFCWPTRPTIATILNSPAGTADPLWRGQRDPLRTRNKQARIFLDTPMRFLVAPNTSFLVAPTSVLVVPRTVMVDTRSVLMDPRKVLVAPWLLLVAPRSVWVVPRRVLVALRIFIVPHRCLRQEFW